MATNNQQEATPLVNEHLDDRVFKFQVYFWNNDGRLIRIPKSTIQELVINDNILNWYHTGTMTFSNPKSVFERASKKYIDEQEIDVLPYRFRNDGRDYIYIEIDIPVEDNMLSNTSLNDETFTLRLLCSVYDTDDIPGNTPDKQMKKVYFWDYRQQLMSERNMMWSTCYAVKRQRYTNPAKSLYLVNDDDRTVYTGDAIKDLITECLKSESTIPEFEDDFSIGGELMFYTSPANAKAADDLEYLLDHHVHDSKNAEPCLLRCDRFTQKWSLLPISEYFNRSYNPDNSLPGSLLKERFFIGDESTSSDVSKNELRTPDVSFAGNNFWFDSNIINSYEFSEIDARDASEYINTTAVHMYDSGKKQFNIHVEQSDIEAVREYIEQNVLKNTLSSEQGLQSTIVLNKNKTENKIMQHLYDITSTSVRDSRTGRNKTMMASMLIGNTINFNIKGMTSRQAGKFISVDRDGGFNDNEYDDKILGLYMTTNVTHTITNNGYTNNITAIKPYLYKKTDFNEDIS